MKRRQILTSVIGTAVLPHTSYSQEENLDNLSLTELEALPSYSEKQYGDPLLADPQNFVFEPAKVKKAGSSAKVEGLKPAQELAIRMADISVDYAEQGVGRDGVKRSLISEFLASVHVHDSSEPFCAAGVTYAACRAYCDMKVVEAIDDSKEGYIKRLNRFQSLLPTIKAHYFYPSAAVRYIKRAAQEKGNWVGESKHVVPLKGWLIVFSWNSESTAGNHIGIVLKSNAESIDTVEFNTAVQVNADQRNGGMVAKKSRPRNRTILGYVKVY